MAPAHVPHEPASPAAAEILERLRSDKAVVGVIGLGYVGLPLCFAMKDTGWSIEGVDVDAAKIEFLRAGRSYIRSIPDKLITSLNQTGRYSFSTELARLGRCDAILICVPTPLTAHREPDLSYVLNTARALIGTIRKKLIVLESTTYPRTTLDVLKPLFEAGGLKSGMDFFLSFSPEREDPGNPHYSTSNIPKVVGGDGPDALLLACELYGRIVKHVVPVSSTDVAEAVKLIENIFRAVNIALVNELKIIFTEMGIDIWEVIDAAKTKPFGYMPFYPGPGLGGHCIPIDPFYLSWKAKEYGTSTRFIELAGEINAFMPQYVVQRLSRALDANFRKGLNGSRVLVVGIAYKKNVDDMRESPALEIIRILSHFGAQIDYFDPFIPTIPSTRRYPYLAGKKSIVLSPDILSGFDAVLICTDHDDVDYKMLAQHARLIVDSRNATRDISSSGGKIIKA